jgi:hypothetical protein
MTVPGITSQYSILFFASRRKFSKPAGECLTVRIIHFKQIVFCGLRVLDGRQAWSRAE